MQPKQANTDTQRKAGGPGLRGAWPVIGSGANGRQLEIDGVAPGIVGLRGFGVEKEGLRAEPSAREINRQIREQARLEKEKEKGKGRGAGAGLAVLARVQKRHPDNPKAQVAAFFAEFAPKAGTGRTRVVSERTLTRYTTDLIGAIDDLRSQRAAIKNMGELGKSHVIRLVGHWTKQEQSAGTIQNKISILRRFLTWIGKEQAVPKGQTLKQLLSEHGVTNLNWRQTVAVRSKAWDENGVDYREIIARIDKDSPLTAIQLEVQAAFGLRMKESLQLNPKAADYGDILRIVHGTKGGLPRDVDFDPDEGIRTWQRDVLERAKLWAEKNRKGILADGTRSLKQNIQHFYYQVRKAGIKKDALGVTAHGLRHQYAARRYSQISGLNAPVSKNAIIPQDKQELQDMAQRDLQARRAVSRELGHFRDDVTKAYIGSMTITQRVRSARMREWVLLTEGQDRFHQAMVQAGVKACWLAGNAAAGIDLGINEKLRIIVRPHHPQPLQSEARQQLRQILGELTGAGIDLSEHFDESDPDDALELIVRANKTKPPTP